MALVKPSIWNNFRIRKRPSVLMPNRSAFPKTGRNTPRAWPGPRCSFAVDHHTHSILQWTSVETRTARAYPSHRRTSKHNLSMVFISALQASSAAIVSLDRAVTARPHHPHSARPLNEQELRMRAATSDVRDLKQRRSPTNTRSHTHSHTTATTRKRVKVVLNLESNGATTQDFDDTTSIMSSSNKTTTKLSTERSRLCRQRQKNYAETLQTSVAALRAHVTDLVALRDLRREQLVHSPVSRSGSLARIVEEYCTVFQHGMASDLQQSSSGGSRKRSLTTSRQLTAQQQCDFLLSIMDPDVQVFDWIGRSKKGPEPLVYGWKAWSKWHAALTFKLQHIDVIQAGSPHGDTIAVSTRGALCVRVSQTTIQQLFPHVADDNALCAQLLGAEIQYPFRDTFYFNGTGRVVKYAVDLDLVAALSAIVGDFQQVANLVAPPDVASFSDRAVCTYDGCSLEHVRASSPLLALPPAPAARQQRDPRLDLQFLLS